MKKTLHIPNESRFVRALALAVEPADTLALLLEIGALSNRDLAPVRRIRESLEAVYNAVSDARDWEAVNVAGVLINALAEPDHQAYLAYHQAGRMTALATIYTAYYFRGSRKRPWSDEPDKPALQILYRILLGENNLLPPGPEAEED